PASTRSLQFATSACRKEYRDATYLRSRRSGARNTREGRGAGSGARDPRDRLPRQRSNTRDEPAGLGGHHGTDRLVRDALRSRHRAGGSDNRELRHCQRDGRLSRASLTSLATDARPAIRWPDGKQFAFTIFDDPDGQTVEDGKRVYGLLAEMGFRTTRGVWPGTPVRTPNSLGAACDDVAYTRH